MGYVISYFNTSRLIFFLRFYNCVLEVIPFVYKIVHYRLLIVKRQFPTIGSCVFCYLTVKKSNAKVFIKIHSLDWTQNKFIVILNKLQPNKDVSDSSVQANQASGLTFFSTSSLPISTQFCSIGIIHPIRMVISILD